MRIAVAGTGYVGLSLAVLLAGQNEVVAVDIVPGKLELIAAGKSPIQDAGIEAALASGGLNLKTALDSGGDDEAAEAYRAADLVIVAVPTDYDPGENYFDTAAVDSVVERVISANDKAVIVVKSTVPVGFTEALRSRLGYERILFSPEFLREGQALYDNLHPGV